MNEITIKLKGTDLTSRRSASEKRKQIDQEINNGNLVSVDLSEVIMMSEAYADELFGIIAINLGVDEFATKIRLLNVSDTVLKSIAIVIRRRKKENGL